MKRQTVRSVFLALTMVLLVALALSACVKAKPVEQPKQEGGASVSLPPAPPMDKVKPLLDKGGCGTCHTIPGVEGATGTVGPEWCDPAKEVQEGKEDLNFLREAIVDPDKEIASGYQAGIMPKNFGDMFTQEEIDTLVAFIANLKCEE